VKLTGRRTVRLIAGSICLLVICLVSASARQQQGPELRARVLAVRVDAVVLDEAGRPVTDLSKDDFQLFEDGQRQELTDVVLVEAPSRLSLAPMPTLAASDVPSNESIGRGSRLIVLVLDDLQTLRGREEIVKRAGARVIERLADGDLVAALCTSGEPQCACDFTTDHAVLLAALEGFRARKTRFDREDSIDGPAFMTNLGKAFGQLDSIKTLKNVTKQLGVVPNQRKSVIYLGEGVEADLAREPVRSEGFRFHDALVDEAHDVVTEAWRSNVAVYVVDPRGETRYLEEGVVSDPEGDGSGVKPFEPWLDRARVSREGLTWLAEQTGGFAAVQRTDFDRAVDQIMTETGTYYLIGYSPTNQKADGKFRRITVEVARPGVTVRARQGYFASEPGKQADPRSETVTSQLAGAIAGPLPATGLTVRMTSTVLKAAGRGRALLLVTTSVEYPVPVDAPSGPLDEEIEVQLVAADLGGKVRGRDRRRVRTSTTVLGQPAPDGFLRAELLLQTEVPTGRRYSVRVAAHATRQQQVGSVFANVDVPRFDGVGLSISSVSVGRSTQEPGAPSGRTAKAAGVPIMPTTVREFTPGDDILAFARLYADASSARPIEVTTTLTTSAGRSAFALRQGYEGSHVVSRRGVIDVLNHVPTADLAPGAYRIDICAEDDTGERVCARSTVVRVSGQT
jgi:VWFA-related protein